MKKLFVALAFVLLAFEVRARVFIPILEQQSIRDNHGQYSYRFATGNGISQTEQGALKNIGTDGPVLVKTGAYSFIGDDGKIYTTRYVADENGFHVIGDHL